MSGKKPQNAFVDANIIVCGLLYEGNESTLLELGRVGAIKLIANNYVLTEVRVVLRRAEFALDDEEYTGLMRYLHECLIVVEDPCNDEILSHINLLMDKKDIPVALGAKKSGVNYLVTGDKELLEKMKPLSITTSGLLKVLLSSLEQDMCTRDA